MHLNHVHIQMNFYSGKPLEFIYSHNEEYDEVSQFDKNTCMFLLKSGNLYVHLCFVSCTQYGSKCCVLIFTTNANHTQIAT